MLTHEQINHVADEVLRAKLGSYGFDHSDVADDVDFDGVDAVRITAHFRSGAELADGSLVIAAVTTLRTSLRQQGEERFAFVRYDYPDDDVPVLSADDFVQ